MTRNEILEKVHAGSKFYVNFEKRSVRVDGKKVDTSDVGMTESDIVNIEITGDVTSLHATSGDVAVNGSCISVSTGSGDVKCEGAVNVSTGSGDVTCSRIGGNVSTGTGDIYRR